MDGAVGGAEVVDVGLVEGGAGELDVGARAVGLDVEPRAAQLRVRLHAPVHVRRAHHREPPPLALRHHPAVPPHAAAGEVELCSPATWLLGLWLLCCALGFGARGHGRMGWFEARDASLVLGRPALLDPAQK